MAIERVQSANAADDNADSRRDLDDDRHGVPDTAVNADGSGNNHRHDGANGNNHRHVGADSNGQPYNGADGNGQRHDGADSVPHADANRVDDACTRSYTGVHGERV